MAFFVKKTVGVKYFTFPYRIWEEKKNQITLKNLVIRIERSFKLTWKLLHRKLRQHTKQLLRVRPVTLFKLFTGYGLVLNSVKG